MTVLFVLQILKLMKGNKVKNWKWVASVGCKVCGSTEIFLWFQSKESDVVEIAFKL